MHGVEDVDEVIRVPVSRDLADRTASETDMCANEGAG